jgi:hypothetical protein
VRVHRLHAARALIGPRAHSLLQAHLPAMRPDFVTTAVLRLEGHVHRGLTVKGDDADHFYTGDAVDRVHMDFARHIGSAKVVYKAAAASTASPFLSRLQDWVEHFTGCFDLAIVNAWIPFRFDQRYGSTLGLVRVGDAVARVQALLMRAAQMAEPATPDATTHDWAAPEYVTDEKALKKPLQMITYKPRPGLALLFPQWLLGATMRPVAGQRWPYVARKQCVAVHPGELRVV